MKWSGSAYAFYSGADLRTYTSSYVGLGGPTAQGLGPFVKLPSMKSMAFG